MSAAPVMSMKLKIKFLRGNFAGQEMNFEQKEILIGRGPENIVAFATDPSVSRRHARLYYENFEWYIENVSGKNYVVVNGHTIEKTQVSSGQVIKIGDQEFILNYGSSKPQVAKPQVRSQQPAYTPVNNSLGTDYSQAPIMNSSATSGGLAISGRVKFYLIIAVIGVLVWAFLSDTPAANLKKKKELRTPEKIAEEIKAAEDSARQYVEAKEKQGKLTPTFYAAQENYLRGFRDYRNGQYVRAIQEFQSALALYPSHELARRYYNLAKTRFDEMIQTQMIQGRKYRESGNFRLCKGSFASVLTLIKDSNDPIFQEAKKFHDECETLMMERF